MGVGAFLQSPGLIMGLERGRPSERTRKTGQGMDMSMGMGIKEDRPTVLLLHPHLDETSILDSERITPMGCYSVPRALNLVGKLRVGGIIHPV